MDLFLVEFESSSQLRIEEVLQGLVTFNGVTLV